MTDYNIQKGDKQIKKKKNYVVFGVLALVVSLVAVSLAYAGFTATLNINGTANVKSAKWHVYFNNVTNFTNGNTASFTADPTITGETLITWGASLATPGESVSFDFTTANDGNFDAKLHTITIGTPTCSTSGFNQAGAAATFDCGTAMELKVQDLTNGGNITATTTGNYILQANNANPTTYRVTLTYKDLNESTITPGSELAVTGLNIQYQYEQDGEYKAS